jgi:UPF0271 protein
VKTLTEKTQQNIIVLDTSAIIAGFDPFSISEEQYTVQMVSKEISENSMSGVRFRTAVENGKVKIKAPDAAFTKKVKTFASAVGDAFFLSETDVQVLALALELKTHGYSPLIATDDYSMQNVANQMRIEFAPLATFGIRRRLKWIRYCPACHRKYPANHKSTKCRVCGTKLKRKPSRKESISR